MTYKGMSYLRKKLALYKAGVDKRYRYYAMQDYEPVRSVLIPHQYRDTYRAVSGWTTKAVDALADRIVFRGFGNDDFGAQGIFEANNPDVFFDAAIQSALIASCCFVYVSQAVNESIPRLQVIEASRATGVIDPTTNLLTEGYAILDVDGDDQPTLEAYFMREGTWYYPKGGKSYFIGHKVGHPLLVPIIHRPDAVRPFGRSRISQAGMYFQKALKRTLERAEIAEEFYSWPQKYIMGTDPDLDLDGWKASMSAILNISRGEDGTTPTMGQFTAASFGPFVEKIKMLAASFAGETGLTMDDLGFPSDNPSSVEAIKAAHENLRLAGQKAQRGFASGFRNVAYLAVCLRDGFSYTRTQFMRTTVKWWPMFEADANMLTLVGDGAIKLNQAIPGFLDGESITELTGVVGRANAATVEVPANGT